MPDGGQLMPLREGQALIAVRILSLCVEAEDVVSLTLRGVGGALPGWEPGAHVDLHLPGGVIRQYSLCGEPGADWRIAVLRLPEGRGGSVAVHGLRLGEVISVSAPRNHFPMVAADRMLFVAGGIGITPILPMVRRAAAMGVDWRLIYLGRSADRMAFAAEVAALDPFRVSLVETDRGGMPDVSTYPALAADGVVHACGPSGLLTALEAAFAAAGRPGDLHLERFAPVIVAQPGDGVVRLHLARSGRFIDVGPEVSLLEGLRAAGVDHPSSCEQGFCGTCECRVLKGVPDHRDTLLSDEERARGDVMLPCVSRAKGNELTLDL